MPTESNSKIAGNKNNLKEPSSHNEGNFFLTAQEQEMLFSIVLRFSNTWFLLCLERLDADWLNNYGVTWRNASIKFWGGGQICQVRSA